MIKVCEEMQQLRKMLDEKGIVWTDESEEMPSVTRILWICRTHFEYDGEQYSVINGFGSYGGWTINGNDNKGMLEVAKGEDCQVIKGWLTAKEAYELIFGE